MPKERVKVLIDFAISPAPGHARQRTLKALADAIGGMVVTTVHDILLRHGFQPPFATWAATTDTFGIPFNSA